MDTTKAEDRGQDSVIEEGRPATDEGRSGGRPRATRGEITEALHRWRTGDAAAAEIVVESLYQKLRVLAASRLAGHDLSLEITELVHELYLSFDRGHQPPWSDRGHFLTLAARKMRQIIIDHARYRSRAKRGAGVRPVALDEVAESVPPDFGADLLALDEGLAELEKLEPEAARVVELRFFAGFNVEETAEILDTSATSVKRRWRFARAWLSRFLDPDRLDDAV